MLQRSEKIRLYFGSPFISSLSNFFLFNLVTHSSYFSISAWIFTREFYTSNKTYHITCSACGIWAWYEDPCQRKKGCQNWHELLDTLYVANNYGRTLKSTLLVFWDGNPDLSFLGPLKNKMLICQKCDLSHLVLAAWGYFRGAMLQTLKNCPKLSLLIVDNLKDFSPFGTPDTHSAWKT